MNQTATVIDELIAGGSNFAASLGINRIAGELYLLLFFSPRALSLDEMTQRLKVSKGHVSTNIRALERWQAVRKVWVKGSRKDYYEANPDTLRIIFRQLRQGLSQRFETLEKIMARAKTEISSLPGAGEAKSNDEFVYCRQRLEKIETMYKTISALLDKSEIFL